jgi:hypothetical protein
MQRVALRRVYGDDVYEHKLQCWILRTHFKQATCYSVLSSIYTAV